LTDIDVYDEAYWTQVVADDPQPTNVTGLHALLEMDLNDPITRWAKERAMRRFARALHVRCAFGNCVELIDPVSGQYLSGSGPAACACQGLPRSFARHPAQRPKKRMDVKAVGRNGSRVLRSRRRQASVGADGLMR
jgi:hypothetical protein